MSILPAEPNVYPVDLFETESESADQSWWVMHTKPRQEKALAREMLRAQVPFYLPLQEQKTIVRGRVMSSHVPLFTSYVFLRASGEQRIAALATRRVVQCLPVKDQQGLQRDLTQVNRLIRSGAPLTPERQFFPGALVEIRLGPLAGLKGKIIREATRRRFVVQVDFIQQGVSVMLEEYMIAAIPA